MTHKTYRFRLGALKCMTVPDTGGISGDAAPFFVNAAPDDLLRACEAH